MRFIDTLDRFADRPVFIDGQSVTFAHQLKAEIAHIKQQLCALGAKPGDVLGLWLPNHASWLSVFMACTELDIIVLTLNTRFKHTELESLLQRSNCRWLAFSPDFMGIPFSDIISKIDTGTLKQLKGFLTLGDASTAKAQFPDIPCISIDSVEAKKDTTSPSAQQAETLTAPGLIYTTSGTTSLPKFVVHAKDRLLQHGLNVQHFFSMNADSALYLTVPLCGAFGFSAVLGALVAGATIIAPPVYDAEQAAKLIREHQATHTFANNEVIAQLLALPGQAKQPFPSLKWLGYASFAPSLGDLPQKAKKAGLQLLGLYGSSELNALCAGQRPEFEETVRLQAGGQITDPKGKVRAVCFDTGKPLPHGEIGELEIYSTVAMLGYMNNHEETQKAFTADGYFKTGDVGYTLADNHFVFSGRKGNLIRLSGFLVNPEEIEEFIQQIEGVKAVQVVGVPINDKTVCTAFVIRQPQSQLDAEQIKQRCRAAMASYKAPQHVFFVDSFPVVQSANSNKIQTHKLVEQAQSLIGNLPS